jgi:hypothetical protein
VSKTIEAKINTLAIALIPNIAPVNLPQSQDIQKPTAKNCSSL